MPAQRLPEGPPYNQAVTSPARNPTYPPQARPTPIKRSLRAADAVDTAAGDDVAMAAEAAPALEVGAGGAPAPAPGPAVSVNQGAALDDCSGWVVVFCILIGR